jgi:hypothetical protein
VHLSQSFVFAAAVLLATACTATSKKAEVPSTTTVFDRGMGFRLTVPRGVDVKLVTEGPDFYVYSVFTGSAKLMSFYVGNYPRFPMSGRAPAETRVGSFPGACVAYDDGQGTSRECLARLGEEFQLRLHFWYGAMSGQSKEVADQIIASLALSPLPAAAGEEPAN